MGWEVNREYIETDANFTPGSTGDDKFKLRFQGSYQELVHVASESAYHTKTESNLKITKLTVGEDNDSGEYWQVITKDGTKYRFGQATNSELMCNSRSYVWRWNLDQVEDTHGNKIFYTYSESNGASLLSKIEYNTEKARVIDFSYETNPYERRVYAQGCNVKEASRLTDIKVKANNNLVHQYDLTYNTATSSAQLLSSLTERGSGGLPLPATTFTYNPVAKGWPSQSQEWLDSAEIDSHLQMSAVTMSDVNGDALPDIVRTIDDSGSGTTWKVLLNQGNRWSSSFLFWVNNQNIEDARLDRNDVRLIDVTGDSLPDIVKSDQGSGESRSTWRVWKNTGNGWNTVDDPVWLNNADINAARIQNPMTALSDVNGDGFADIVQSSGGSTWQVYKNNGTTWNTSYESWAAPSTVDLDSTRTRLVDINGDGLPDIVKSIVSGSNVTWNVYRNTGSSWETTADPWINNVSIDADFEDDDVELGDVNGDGLPDIIRSTDMGSNDKWEVLINQGDSWSTTWQTWIDTSQNVDVDIHSYEVRITDVNGDGLSDIVRGRADCACNFDTWEVWSNKGHANDLLSGIKVSQGGLTSFEYASTSAMFDNTGNDSLPDLPFGMPVVGIIIR